MIKHLRNSRPRYKISRHRGTTDYIPGFYESVTNDLLTYLRRYHVPEERIRILVEHLKGRRKKKTRKERVTNVNPVNGSTNLRNLVRLRPWFYSLPSFVPPDDFGVRMVLGRVVTRRRWRSGQGREVVRKGLTPLVNH